MGRHLKVNKYLPCSTRTGILVPSRAAVARVEMLLIYVRSPSAVKEEDIHHLLRAEI